MTTAVLVDLDNTLALLGDRDPYQPSACEGDDLNLKVWSITHQLADRGHKVLYLTARNEVYRDVTKCWLDKHRCPPGELYMKSDEVKQGGATALEFKRKSLETLVLHYKILYAIDDSFDNLALYRQYGIASYHPSLL